MQTLTSIYKLLSDETRLRLLVLLYQEPLCVCELVGILGVPQPRISKNLAKFRDLGLVTDERQDKYVYYTLKKDNPILMHQLLFIVDNMAEYPDFKEDSLNLKDKSKYLTTCQPVVNFQ